jgi:Phosphate-starvation-inducible E family
MPREKADAEHRRWHRLGIYATFEHLVVHILIGLIVVTAVWSLALEILFALIESDAFDPTDHAVFQGVFGMIFTVIIALELK